jgi:hypothetical protein
METEIYYIVSSETHGYVSEFRPPPDNLADRFRAGCRFSEQFKDAKRFDFPRANDLKKMQMIAHDARFCRVEAKLTIVPIEVEEPVEVLMEDADKIIEYLSDFLRSGSNRGRVEEVRGLIGRIQVTEAYQKKHVRPLMS